MVKTDTALDQDCGTEMNCLCMDSVHCRVMVDNKSDFYQIRKMSKNVKKCQQHVNILEHCLNFEK